jgi:hypothetical protein
MLRGDYKRALDYLDMDRESEVSNEVSIDVLVRQGKLKTVLQQTEGKVPPWGGYGVLMAYLEHRPAQEAAALARQVQPASDPEINFFSAAHLSYVGQTDAALDLLRRTIAGGYCSYPAIDSDPLFANLRTKREYQEVRLAGRQCQKEFLKQRHGR